VGREEEWVRVVRRADQLALSIGMAFRISNGSVMATKVERLRPLHDQVLVRRQESTHKTASGIVIPDTASEKPDQGEVIAAGPGEILKDGRVRPPDVKVGDKVLFGKYAGQPVKIGVEDLIVMREEDIIAVL
jgi:chaperonin GroES